MALATKHTVFVNNGVATIIKPGHELPEGKTPYAGVPEQSPEAYPNGHGFISAIKNILGGILGSNNLSVKYPAFTPAVAAGEWFDVQVLIIDAHTNSVITPSQYTEIQTAALANNIPVNLP
jgi:hypothetical protein